MLLSSLLPYFSSSLWYCVYGEIKSILYSKTLNSLIMKKGTPHFVDSYKYNNMHGHHAINITQQSIKIVYNFFLRTFNNSPGVPSTVFSKYNNIFIPFHQQLYIVQVAVLAPLALLLSVLEARCHFVIAHFINIVCCGVVHHCSHTAHIHDDKLITCYKDVSEHYRDCNGNSSAHAQCRRHLDLVLLLSGLCNTTITYHDYVL